MWPSGLIFFVIGSDIQVIFHSEMAVLLNLIRLLFMTELFVFFFFKWIIDTTAIASC